MDTANTLADLLIDRNISLTQLSCRSGVSLSTLSNWLNGKHRPNVLTRLRVARALDVTPETLDSASRGKGGQS
jgi:transcriptional regulator with XRE-family HTH domain